MLKLNLNAFPVGSTVRPLIESDAPELARLDNAHSRRCNGLDHRSSDEWRMSLERPGIDLQRDSVGVFTATGRLVGCAMAVNMSYPYNESMNGFMLDDEALGHCDQNEPHPGEQALLEWALQVQRSRLPEAPPHIQVVARMGFPAVDTRTRQVAERLGFKLARYFLHMRIDMDVEPQPARFPTGISCITLAETPDPDAVAVAFDEAFRDHFAYTERPRKQLLAEWQYITSSDPYADPSLCFIAVDGEEIAGFCVNRSRTTEDPEMGYVAVLGVRPAWRKRGLGLALLMQTFSELYRRGRRSVGLHVDADSLTGATRLYEKAGMHEDRRIIFLERVLREGKDISNGDEAAVEA